MQLTRVFRTNQFKHDAKTLFKKHYDASELAQAIEVFLKQNRTELRTRYRDHALKRNQQGYHGIHVEADWLVIYRTERDELPLVLARTGSHDDLFQTLTSWETHWLEIPINLAASRWVIPACTRTRAAWWDFSLSC